MTKSNKIIIKIHFLYILTNYQKIYNKKIPKQKILFYNYFNYFNRFFKKIKNYNKEKKKLNN